jgi:cyanophycin synthetase
LINIRRIWTLCGPNQWARFPVLEVWAELGEFQKLRTDAVPGLCDRLLAWLPGLAQHPAPAGQDGNFADALRRGTTLANVLERTVVELQTRAGNPVSFGLTQAVRNEPGVYQVVFQYEEPPVAEACLEAACRLVLAAVQGQTFALPAELERLTDLADRNRLGRASAAVVNAARKRNIPVEHLNPEDGRLVALGWGNKQRWLLAAQTDRTPDLGQMISQDKELTKSLLRTIGVPVPEGRPVKTADDAWAVAEELGGPVATKPRDRDLSVGVRVNLTTREQVVAGFELARQKAEEVIVEQYARGFDHRVFVVQDKVIAVSRIEPPLVYGDGRATIAQLVERVNAEPDRGDGYATPRAKIICDEWAVEALNCQGYTLDSIPAAGVRVRLRYHPPAFENGGAIVDVTDEIHPEVAARVLEATRLLGLDVAGADVVVEDIRRPLEEQGGMILEVNVGPALWIHMAPWCNPSRPVAEAIVASVIPEGDGRIPIVAVTGVNGKTTTTWLLTHILRGAGRKVGMACTDGLFIEGRQISRRDCSGPQSARAVLRNPAVDAAVLETARGGILRQGLGFDFCDVAVVTNVGEGDHLGLRGVETREELADVKSTLVQAVPPHGFAVLNAADPLVVTMAPQCRGQVAYFARDGEHFVVAQHLAAGGRAAIVRDGRIVLAEGDRSETLVDVKDVPMTHGGQVGFQVENALAAAAAAWLLGVPCEAIRTGLSSFVADEKQAAGRFNVFTLRAGGKTATGSESRSGEQRMAVCGEVPVPVFPPGDATVIVDFAHNASALMALGGVLESFAPRRRTIVYGGCDRRDDDVIRQGEALAASFDRVLLYRDEAGRERQAGELSGLVRKGIANAPQQPEVIEYPDEIAAIEAGLDAIQPGDLLVLAPDSLDKAIEMVRQRMASAE